MDMGDAHSRISVVDRVAVVGAACAADMIINFPLWITAKRVSAGLSLPGLPELYKGSGSLFLAMGPMLTIADKSTAISLGLLEDRVGNVDARHAIASCVSGAVGALCVGGQIEGHIARAHATGHTVWQTVCIAYRTGGPALLALPHGTLMVAAREFPYGGCLFFLSGRIREQVRTAIGSDGASSNAVKRIASDMASAALTAVVAGPLSHAPSVVAAHQQAHGVPFLEACNQIRRSAGVKGFFLGLLPRTCSLAGSLFVFPLTVETVQPIVERWRQR